MDHITGTHLYISNRFFENQNFHTL